MGLAQELPSTGRAGSTLVERSPQRGGGLSGPASQSRDARLAHGRPGAAYRKGHQQEAKLSHLGHVLSENRHGLVVDVELSEANGYGEREAALAMLERSVRGRATLGADRAYDTRNFRGGGARRGVTPHVARNDRGLRSAIDGRTTRHAGYGRSLRQRKLVEEVFGWLKTVGGGRWAQAALHRTTAQSRLAGAHRSGVQPRAPLAVGARSPVGGVRPPAQPAPILAAGGAAEAFPKPRNPSPGRLGSAEGHASYARDRFFSTLLALERGLLVLASGPGRGPASLDPRLDSPRVRPAAPRPWGCSTRPFDRAAALMASHSRRALNTPSAGSL